MGENSIDAEAYSKADRLANPELRVNTEKKSLFASIAANPKVIALAFFAS